MQPLEKRFVTEGNLDNPDHPVRKRLDAVVVDLAGSAPYSTATRPSPAIGAGRSIFDTTLGRPLWSTGAAWVDATGAPS